MQKFFKVGREHFANFFRTTNLIFRALRKYYKDTIFFIFFSSKASKKQAEKHILSNLKILPNLLILAPKNSKSFHFGQPNIDLVKLYQREDPLEKFGSQNYMGWDKP